MFTKILVPIDGSEASWHAFDYAKTIGGKFASELVVVHVVQPFYNAGFLAIPVDNGLLAAQMEDMKANAQNLLEAAQEKLSGYPAKVTTKVDTGHPAERVLAVAAEHCCDAIVIGSRGLSGIAEFVLGSVSSNVAQYARVPVLIVKNEKEEKK